MKLEFPEEKLLEEKFVIDKSKEVPVRRQPFLVDQVSDGISRPKSFTKPIPQSDLLSRLGEFLPKIRNSNEELAQKNSEDLDIEQVPEGSEYIQMDLGLGVFDTMPKDAPIPEVDDIRLTATEPKADSIVSFFGQDSDSDDTTDTDCDTDADPLVTVL